MTQDFRETKIKILSEEHSRAFQEAVISAGGWWGGERGRYLHSHSRFLFVAKDLRLTYCDSPSFFESHEYKEIQFPLPTISHVHAELMAQYAEDAKATTKPWELWQVSSCGDIWYTLEDNPSWCSTHNYRRKPKTHTVNGVEVPDLRIKDLIVGAIDVGWIGYCVDPLDAKLHAEHYSVIPETTKRFLELGILYEPTESGRQAAILHAKAWLGTAQQEKNQ